MIQPPSTAPSALSKPPRVAAAKAYTSTPPIRLTSRNSRGATRMPAIAPTVAASPHPSISMRPTRMPTSRLDTGSSAAARIASPSRVRWNSRNSRPTTTSSTATMPSDSIDSRTPPTPTVPSGKVDGKPRLENPQIQPAPLLMRMNSPRVTITRVSGWRPSTGRITIRSSSAPPPNDSASAARIASGSATPASVMPQVRKVENIAISPWAKLTTPVDR